jgi:hypothetical protein
MAYFKAADTLPIVPRPIGIVAHKGKDDDMDARGLSLGD